MNPAASLLVLKPTLLRGTSHDGNVVRRPESHFLDFVIDGHSLSDLIPESKDMVTLLSRPWPDAVPNSVDQLCGRRTCTDLARGRVPLYVCGACGDLAWGAVTAALNVGETTTTWADFRWENGRSPGIPIQVDMEHVSFASGHYVDVFSDAVQRVAAMPYSRLDHEGRRFLWPWQWGWRLPSGENESTPKRKRIFSRRHMS